MCDDVEDVGSLLGDCSEAVVDKAVRLFAGEYTAYCDGDVDAAGVLLGNAAEGGFSGEASGFSNDCMCTARRPADLPMLLVERELLDSTTASSC